MNFSSQTAVTERQKSGLFKKNVNTISKNYSSSMIGQILAPGNNSGLNINKRYIEEISS
jgi:hypothetical protein